MQATGYCKTWAGEGGADAGTVQAATDLEFYIDLDPATGQETVVVAEVKPVRRQARALTMQPVLPLCYGLFGLSHMFLKGPQKGLLLRLRGSECVWQTCRCANCLLLALRGAAPFRCSTLSTLDLLGVQ